MYNEKEEIDENGTERLPNKYTDWNETKDNKRVEMQDLLQWNHFDPTNTSERNLKLLEDPILKDALRYLSYVFMNEVDASAVHRS